VTNDFGIQTHSPPLANPSSEASNPHFVASFSIGTALATFQPGSHVEVSPDEGNGARMSFLKFTDQADGVHVRFLDVHQPGPCSPAGCATFVATDPIAIFPIGTAHTFTFDITLNPGPGNDVVQIFMDNALIHTGTTWEDYYRYDPESGLTPPPPISKLLFRVSGSPAYNPTLLGTGYLFDNVMLTSGPTPVAAVDACLVPATITGTNGNDVIQGTSGNDVIWALGGNDQVFGNGGDDVICGGTGNDTITTLGGNDSINAGDGNDTVNAGGGSNYVIAGKGDDRITTGDGDDTVDAGDGNDTVNAGGGNNQVTGGKGDDRITTGDGDDTVDGGDGNDTIASGGGTDTLTGGAGNDSLNGGAGTDSCTGGTGNNTLTNCEV
jgi:Ca2+-binding RTX toxin-like protein